MCKHVQPTLSWMCWLVSVDHFDLIGFGVSRNDIIFNAEGVHCTPSICLCLGKNSLFDKKSIKTQIAPKGVCCEVEKHPEKRIQIHLQMLHGTGILGYIWHKLMVHSPKQTWNLKMDPWKRRFLLETTISRFHVNFWGCKCRHSYSSPMDPSWDIQPGISKSFSMLEDFQDLISQKTASLEAPNNLRIAD